MLKMADLEVGQSYLVTTKGFRVAQVLELGRKEVQIAATKPNEPPTKEIRNIAKVMVCTPARPIPGYLTQQGADENLFHRQECLANFGYDMWTETWIDHPRERVILVGKPHTVEGEWEWVIKVHLVEGRHARHETIPAPGKLGPRGAESKHLGSGSLIDGILIPEEDVHPQLFQAIGVNEKTQAQMDLDAHNARVIKKYVREQKAIEAAKQRGDPAECTQWEPATRLKAQLDACGLDWPKAKGGTFNVMARAILSTYLKGIGINPWDVMEYKKEEMQDAVKEARAKLML